MTVESRMQPRSSREKDLLKYGSKQGIEQEQERIFKLIDEFAENTDYPEVEWTLGNLKNAIGEEQK